MLGTFRLRSSLIALTMCIFLFHRMWTVLMLYFARGLMILLEITFWCGSTAILVSFSFFNFGFCFGCRGCLISFLLHLFYWKIYLRCWISPLRLPVSQSILSRQASVAHFFARWCSDLAWRYRSMYTECPSDPSNLLLTKTSRNSKVLFCSTSIVNFMFRWI